VGVNKIIVGAICLASLSVYAQNVQQSIRIGGDGSVNVNGAGTSISVDSGKPASKPVKTANAGKSRSVTNHSYAGANLAGRDFSGYTFTNVDFKGANLQGARFTNASLTNVDFSGANLRGVDWTDTSQTNVDRSGALE
jgi:uncharacterized protein YjbI with pentapeptide repeats